MIPRGVAGLRFAKAKGPTLVDHRACLRLTAPVANGHTGRGSTRPGEPKKPSLPRIYQVGPRPSTANRERFLFAGIEHQGR